MCLLGLIKAAKNFDDNYGTKFSTYACRCMDNEVRMIFRKENKRENTTQLSQLGFEDKEGNQLLPTTVYEKLSSEGGQDSLIESMWLQQAVNNLNPRQQRIINLYFYQDKTQDEIGEALDLSQSYICRLLKQGLVELETQYRNSNHLAAN